MRLTFRPDRRWPSMVVVSAVLVAACTASAAAPEPTVLRVVMADDWAETGPVIDAVRAFEREHPGTRVDVRGEPFSRIPEVVRTAAAAGEPLDLAQWHPFAAAAQGLAEPLDDLWDAHLDPATFLPGAIADVRWGGSLFGVPLDTNAMVLLANREAVEQAHVRLVDIRTLEDLRAAAAALRATGRRALTWPSNSWVVYGLIRANGGEVVTIDEDGRPVFTLDAPEVVTALETAGKMIAAREAYPPTQRDDADGGSDLFRTGRAAFHATGTWDLAAFQGAVPWEVAVLQVPRGPDADGPGTALGGSGLFVPTGSDQRELAFAFILELTDDETALALARDEGRLPARQRVFADPIFDTPAFDTVRAALETAHPMRLIAYPEAQQAFADAIDAVLLGRASAQEALAVAQRTASRSSGEAS